MCATKANEVMIKRAKRAENFPKSKTYSKTLYLWSSLQTLTVKTVMTVMTLMTVMTKIGPLAQFFVIFKGVGVQ